MRTLNGPRRELMGQGGGFWVWRPIISGLVMFVTHSMTPCSTTTGAMECSAGCRGHAACAAHPTGNASTRCYGDKCTCSVDWGNQAHPVARIDCSGANLTEIPEFVPYCENVTVTDTGAPDLQVTFTYDIALSNNDLKSLHVEGWNSSDSMSTISQVLKRTAKLDLSYNSLRNVSDFVDVSFESLEVLSLQHNHLRDVSFLLSIHAPLLTELHLHKNRINYLPDTLRNHTLRNLPRLQQLSLHGNQWSCDCESSWTPQWFRNHSDVVFNVYGVTCARPLEMAGRSITALSQEDLSGLDCGKGSDSKGMPMYVVAVIVLVVVYIVAASAFAVCLALRNRQRVKAAN